MSGVFGWANAVAFSIGGQTVLWADLGGSVCALATVGLAVRRSMLTWPVQVLACVLLFGASVDAHLGGNAGKQVILAVMAGYGWWRWQRGRRTEHEVAVRFATGQERVFLVVLLALGTAAFAAGLAAFHASYAPVPDAYIFVGSAVATLAQARGWVEFWAVWVLVDAVGVPLAWTHGLVVSGTVYGVFFVMCLIGIRDWAVRARSRSMEVRQA